LATSSGRSVLKIRPPLAISNSEIELLVERLAAVLRERPG
jgi:4-aminobutyrate aminotransferase-like enzyme